MDTMEVEDFRVENTVLKAVVAIDSKVEIVLVMDTKVVDGVLEVAVDTIVEVVEDFRMGNHGGRGHGGWIASGDSDGYGSEVVVDGMVEVVKIL
ncbi:hypothetical protein Bca52824_044947 [Brassica carinata]|uniref:Uncharacterized protein n=1 Tax=Brassica carinata TaxID=52824 RepID=A0A8X7RCI6_BRACI|nr:hypothetical protein Bca52824_044947 [Brassica carinata]